MNQGPRQCYQRLLSWVWCTIRRCTSWKDLVAAGESPLCERAPKWSANPLLAVLGSTCFQFLVCVNQAGVGETAALLPALPFPLVKMQFL